MEVVQREDDQSGVSSSSRAEKEEEEEEEQHQQQGHGGEDLKEEDEEPQEGSVDDADHNAAPKEDGLDKSLRKTPPRSSEPKENTTTAEESQQRPSAHASFSDKQEEREEEEKMDEDGGVVGVVPPKYQASPIAIHEPSSTFRIEETSTMASHNYSTHTTASTASNDPGRVNMKKQRHRKHPSTATRPGAASVVERAQGEHTDYRTRRKRAKLGVGGDHGSVQETRSNTSHIPQTFPETKMHRNAVVVAGGHRGNDGANKHSTSGESIKDQKSRLAEERQKRHALRRTERLGVPSQDGFTAGNGTTAEAEKKIQVDWVPVATRGYSKDSSGLLTAGEEEPVPRPTVDRPGAVAARFATSADADSSTLGNRFTDEGLVTDSTRGRGLISAVLVEEGGGADAPVLVTAVADKRRRRIIIFGLILLVAVGIAVAVSVSLTRRATAVAQPSETPSSVPTQNPSASPSFQRDDLLELLISVSTDEGDGLLTTDSPQQSAFQWLSANANLTSYTDSQVFQRCVT